MKVYQYCPYCKGNLVKIKEEGYLRLQCEECQWRYYHNPLPAVAAFVQNEKDEILLIKRGVEPQKGKWALPSGFIEQTELPEEAVIRELKEETGIRGSVQKLLGVHIEPTEVYGNVLLLGYEISPVGYKPRPKSDTQEVRFFPLNKLPNIPFASHRAIIKQGLEKESKNSYIEILKSKITEAVITKTVLYYKGSMGIDTKLMELANILPGEKVSVLNYDNGERLETYTIPEKANSGRFVLYGPASLKGKPGQRLCILSYTIMETKQAEKFKPKIIILGKNNTIKTVKS